MGEPRTPRAPPSSKSSSANFSANAKVTATGIAIAIANADAGADADADFYRKPYHTLGGGRLATPETTPTGAQSEQNARSDVKIWYKFCPRSRVLRTFWESSVNKPFPLTNQACVVGSRHIKRHQLSMSTTSVTLPFRVRLEEREGFA